MKIKIIVTHNNKVYDISNLCKDDIKLDREIKNSPSKMTFTVCKNVTFETDYAFSEGDNVKFWVDDYPMFNGFIFTRKRGKEQEIEITAYDQMRYLKNKDTYIYDYTKASDILKMIAEDYNLSIGEIEDTGFVIENLIEDNKSLFDIILDGIDITLSNAKEWFVLYDDFGKLTLKNVNSMRLPLLMVTDDGTVTDFTYTTDIDSDTYNRIKMYKDNEDTGKREIFISQDSGTQQKWGILQYYEKAPDNYNDAQIGDYTDKLLVLKNRVKQSLSVECIGMGNGELDIRGGSEIFVKVDNCGEYNINNWFIVEKCTHTFSNNMHTFKIDLFDF